MQKETNVAYTGWAILLMSVILMGSPLASFGCQTIIPAQFQMTCDAKLLDTAVQTNFAQPIAPLTAGIILLMIHFWLQPQLQTPQEVFLSPPLPPPRPLN